MVTDALEGARQILAHSMGTAERPVPALIHILAPAPWSRLIARVAGWRASVGARGVLTALGAANRRAIFPALVHVITGALRARVVTWIAVPHTAVGARRIFTALRPAQGRSPFTTLVNVKAGGKVRASTVSRRTDAFEGAVSVGTDAALAKILLTALVHVQTRCSTRSRPIARGTGTGKGAVGVEALSMGEAEVAFQTLIYICTGPGSTRWCPVTCRAAAVEGALGIRALAMETARSAGIAFVHISASATVKVVANRAGPALEGAW